MAKRTKRRNNRVSKRRVSKRRASKRRVSKRRVLQKRISKRKMMGGAMSFPNEIGGDDFEGDPTDGKVLDYDYRMINLFIKYRSLPNTEIESEIEKIAISNGHANGVQLANDIRKKAYEMIDMNEKKIKGQFRPGVKADLRQEIVELKRAVNLMDHYLSIKAPGTMPFPGQ